MQKTQDEPAKTEEAPKKKKDPFGNVKKTILKSALMLLLLLSVISVPGYAEENISTGGAPKITVYLTNSETGNGNANPAGPTKVTARVVYEGCVEGQEYVFALSMAEQSTGMICNASDGNSVIKQSFTAERRSGVFEFEFELDTSNFAGRILKEFHYIEGMEWAYDGETIENPGLIYVPKIEVNAISESGAKSVLAGKDTVVCDVMSYYGLIPGEEYRLVTGLMDSKTGRLIYGSNGASASATSKFTPTESEGQIATKITANLRVYGNKEVTLFEDIYIVSKTGIPILLFSSKNSVQEGGTVSVRYAEISVLDEMYGTAISGVKLEFRSESDGKIFSRVSLKDGKCRIPMSKNEAYTCTVISGPENYLLYGDILDFSAPAGEDMQALTIKLRQKNTIVLTRSDAETGEPLPGIVTEVRDENGRFIEKITSDEDGKCRFDANQYWNEAEENAHEEEKSSFSLSFSFKDVSTPSEYYPKESSWTVSIDESNGISGNTELLSYRRYPLAITVTTVDGQGIPGVGLSIIGQNGKVQGRATTDHDGKIYFTPKRTGGYVVAEDEVPPGYVSLMHNRKFTVGENGEITGNLTITNLSNDFTGIASTVGVLTGVTFVLGLTVSLLIRKSIRKKLSRTANKHEKNSK